METLLWAIDLVLVAGLCFWAIREDSKSTIDNMSAKTQKVAKGSPGNTRNSDNA